MKPKVVSDSMQKKKKEEERITRKSGGEIEGFQGGEGYLVMNAISELNQFHVNSSYSTDDGHFPELLW